MKWNIKWYFIYNISYTNIRSQTIATHNNESETKDTLSQTWTLMSLRNWYQRFGKRFFGNNWWLIEKQLTSNTVGGYCFRFSHRLESRFQLGLSLSPGSTWHSNSTSSLTIARRLVYILNSLNFSTTETSGVQEWVQHMRINAT